MGGIPGLIKIDNNVRRSYRAKCLFVTNYLLFFGEFRTHARDVNCSSTFIGRNFARLKKVNISQVISHMQAFLSFLHSHFLAVEI
jgi:hypothetical protein